MPRFISKVSSNHYQGLDYCLEPFDIYARVGCDVIKFQLIKIEWLFAPGIPAKSEECRTRKGRQLKEESLHPRVFTNEAEALGY